MDSLPGEIDGAKKGAAVLAACLAATLSETDPSFAQRLTARIDEAYARLRDTKDADLHALELLAWTRTLITGFEVAGGQGAPFFES